jgi:hypothetical protein
MVEEAGYPDMFDQEDLKQIAINTMKEVLKFRVEMGRFPNKHSKNPTERKLGQWLCLTRSIKARKSKGTWYPILQDMVEEAGYPDMLVRRLLGKINISEV